MGTIIFLVYLAGTLVFLLPISKWILREMFSIGENDSGDYWLAATGALCICWSWPLLIPGWWIVQMLKNSEGK